MEKPNVMPAFEALVDNLIHKVAVFMNNSTNVTMAEYVNAKEVLLKEIDDSIDVCVEGTMRTAVMAAQAMNTDAVSQKRITELEAECESYKGENSRLQYALNTACASLAASERDARRAVAAAYDACMHTTGER